MKYFDLMTSLEEQQHADSGFSDNSLTDDEVRDLTDSEPSPVSVMYSTQDFDVAGLVKRMQRGQMIVPQFGGADERVVTAGFQRGFVWSKAQMDRFIESLLLGYPVPGIFLIRQAKDNRLLVLDGQQRLITLRRFFEGVHAGKEFTLNNVGDEFKGHTYKTLDESLQFKLDDSFLQATIVSADGTDEVNDAIYQIFERLNSGGTQLTPHEIRVALYAGELIDYMETLNNNEDWREIYGKKSARIRDQELILRILSFYLDGEQYSKPLKSFLNSFVGKYREMPPNINSIGELFLKACAALNSNVGKASLRRPGGLQPNVAQSEAIVVGTMRAIDSGEDLGNLHEQITKLKNDERFEAATTRFTADKDVTELRLKLATQMIGNKAE